MQIAAFASVSDIARKAGRSLPVCHRVLLSLLGTYAFAWGFAALGMALLVAAGVGFHDAEAGMLILSFLIFLPVFIWAFTRRSLVIVWAVLGGGSLLMTGMAWAVQRAIT